MATTRRAQIHRFYRVPIGDRDCSNDTYETPDHFAAETLRVFFRSIALSKLDFEEITTNSFRIIIDPDDKSRLNRLPRADDDFFVHYALL